MSDIELTLDGSDEKDKRLDNITENLEKKDIHLKFSEEENKQIDDFSKKIDLTNSNIILQYGVGAQKKITDFSEKTLSAVKSKDLGEIGNLLNNVVVELQGIEDEEQSGIMGFFKQKKNKLEAIKMKYSSAEKNVDHIVKTLEDHQITLLKDISMLDQMYKLNEDYYKELSMYIEAGKRKLEKTYTEDIPNLENNAKETNSPEDAQKARDLRDMANRFDKKLHDLDLTRMVSLQMAPQIRMVQSSNALMAEKIQTTITNTIPLWKNQMVMALGMYHTQQAIKSQKAVNELTNKLLRQNAEKLKMNTIETAKASEEGIVDLETIRNTNENLISALEEVKKIQIEGVKKRNDARIELANLEENLKHTLIGDKNE
ncbi:MAG: toxic anion resistance protein [Peptoniphilaceae bacterium]|nr:toxic anion resistance protein [Peptoniphilaceae bacterium]MDD7383047.1 toxic anion resistance protein [Peptoniphilaceae bacterium]MDY3737555.1 toxic anion resistance protein [Peptoniphilaceae bacterium]